MNYGDSLVRKLRPSHAWEKLKAEGRHAIAPYAARRSHLRHEAFELWGETLPYFVHPHNSTWRNERAVEIPAALAFLETVRGRGMEFGNVLRHYGITGPSDVVDRYERSPGVLNVDILDYSAAPFDFIVSISTLEHVGWDERPRDVYKSEQAFNHLRCLLVPNGRMLLTVPLGHNPTVDDAAAAGRWSPERQACLVRQKDGRWRDAGAVEVRPYGGRVLGATAVWIAEFRR